MPLIICAGMVLQHPPEATYWSDLLDATLRESHQPARILESSRGRVRRRPPDRSRPLRSGGRRQSAVALLACGDCYDEGGDDAIVYSLWTMPLA